MTVASDVSITDRLLALEPVKTWSLIVTVFGDLDADRASGKALKSLLEPLGIKPEAMRVALHRLKKDGWIVSEKAGREVIYQLSERARRETMAAHEDVYRRDVAGVRGWRMVVLPPGAALPQAPGRSHLPHVMIDKNLCVMPAGADLPDGSMAFTFGAHIPEWLELQLVPAHMRAQATRLTGLAAQFQAHAPNAAAATSARLMFLHLWRKMALRPGTWVHIGLMPDGAMARCHAAMTRIFDQTEPPRA